MRPRQHPSGPRRVLTTAGVVSITTTTGRPRRVERPSRVRAVVLVAVSAFLLSFGAVTALVETSVGASNTSVPAGAPRTVVAKPGDTIWAIARRIMPEGNINALVAELVQLNGASINAGQLVRIP